MPIKVSCACGKTLSVKDEFAGRTVKCPACQSRLSIPLTQDELAAVTALQETGVEDPDDYVSLFSESAYQESKIDAPECSANPVVWRGFRGNGNPVSVILDRKVGMIHFQNCATRMPFLLGWPLRQFSCSLHDLRCFHERPMKQWTALVLKTNLGKVTVLFVSGDLSALIKMLSEVLPGGHRRFHEDHPLAILLVVLAGVSAIVLADVLVPDQLHPKSPWGLLIALAFVVMATRLAISVWTGKPSPKQ